MTVPPDRLLFISSSLDRILPIFLVVLLELSASSDLRLMVGKTPLLKGIWGSLVNMYISTEHRKKEATALNQETDIIRDRSVRLFTFLKELSELQTKTTRRVDQYEKVLWLKDIPHEPQCRCAAWFSEPEKDQETWLRIEKPGLSDPPELPDSLKPWLDPAQVNNSSLEMPELRQRIAVAPPDHRENAEASETPQFTELSDHPEIEPLWERYVENHWWPWAEKDKRLQPIQKVYTDLFSIYQKQQQVGEKFEVILGLGLLAWKTPSGHEVHRHVVTAKANISFNSVRGVITVGPTAEGARLTLEQDMLEAHERPGIVEQKAVANNLEEIGNELWNEDHLDTVLKGWVQAVSARGEYKNTLVPPSRGEHEPQVCLAPALILRERTERSLIRMFQEIIEQLGQGKDIPIGVRRLVEVVADNSTGAHNGEHPQPGTTAIDSNIYFPRLANEKQKEIVSRLATTEGLLVQGPPGTGKSHTIANLVCHLLATGQKVLVTSQTARALKVLRDKLPFELRNLCVSLLGDDRRALQHLEECVQGITRRYNHWDPAENEREIRYLEQELDLARRREAQIADDMRSLRESETYSHHLGFGGYEGTAAVIAKRIKDEEAIYGWIGKPEVADDTVGAPLTNSEAVTLLQLLRTFKDHQQEDIIPIEIRSTELMDPVTFKTGLRLETKACATSEAMKTYREHPGYPALQKAALELRENLLTVLEELLSNSNNLARQPQPWVNQATLDVLTGQHERWRALYQITAAHLDHLQSLTPEVTEYRVTGLEDHDVIQVRAEASPVVEHLEAGKRLGWGPFRDKTIKNGWYLITQVRVNGCLCDNIETLRELLQWLDATDRLSQLQVHWQACNTMPDGPPRMQWSFYHDLAKTLSHILELSNVVSKARQAILSIPNLPEPAWHKSDEAQALVNALHAAREENALRETSNPLLALEDQLSEATQHVNSHPVYILLRDAVRDRNHLRYEEHYQGLHQLEDNNRALAERNDLLAGLRKVLPDMAEKLTASCHDNLWDERMAHLEAGWDWARADGWLVERNKPEAANQLASEFESCRNIIREIIGKLTAAKAWRHFFARMNEYQRQHLMAWTLAVGKLGKGTGKYTAQYRREAQHNMEECRSAIPAWIMPLYRVAESVRPDTDAFDVVIIDEASQSGPEALALQYLAKKIIIVGDDKQISPDFVGVNREDVNLLRERYLADVPLKETFGLETSLFDQAIIRYPVHIRLREHFRCMPEIIQFSNNLCYSSEPLIPLRQYGAQRLEPIKVTHVPNGYRQGNDRVVNPPEAEAIVEQIAACVNDSAYDSKTMGVISLQKPYQAQEVERLLIQRIGPEEMERRNLVCGDAYDFQGDERDVIFLSLVAATSEQRRIGSMTKASDQRRFNVAASRAKDQLWLFHTATLNDLNPECVRYRLLDYCLHPGLQPVTSDHLEPPEDTLVDPFESLFEQRVYRIIAGRGYRVIPQHKVAGRRIDLVVQGMQGQMAVECDGDRWHGPEEYDKDMRRQRQLERCGWTFWRVRGSEFYRDPEKAMMSLWPLLDRLKIHPSAVNPPIDNSLPAHSNEEQNSSKGSDADTTELSSQLESFHGNGTVNGGNVVEPDPSPQTTNREGVPSPHRDTPLDREGVIKSYQHWHPQTLRDPRTAALGEIVEGVVSIIAAEGPVLEDRVYRIYCRAAGIHKTGKQIRSTLARALGISLKRGLVVARMEYQDQKEVHTVVRLAGTPEVVLRTRGDRTLEEIPFSEIAAVMQRLLGDVAYSREQLYRNVLDHYCLVRLTKSAQQTLDKAFHLLDDTQSQIEHQRRGVLRRLK